MSILAALATEPTSGPGVWPFVFGGGALVILLLAMLALLAFGKGREHS